MADAAVPPPADDRGHRVEWFGDRPVDGGTVFARPPADTRPRTQRMPGGALHTRHVARKRHVCGWDCHEWILPGASYVRSALPPRTDANESDHWWYQSLHGSFPNECPRRHGVIVSPSAAEVDRVR